MVNMVDVFALSFAVVVAVLTARVLELSRRPQELPSRRAILARFHHRSSRLWLSFAMLAAVDVALIAFAVVCFGGVPGALLGIGAHGWALGVALLTTAALVSVVLAVVVSVWVRAR
ncbi:MAG: hypothetical protein AAFZ38_08395 [Myxococcota bacterium]